MALRHRPYNVPDQIRQPGINWNDLEYAGNIAGHVADYAMGRGDFAPLPPAKRNYEKMEADSSSGEGSGNNTSSNNIAPALRGGDSIGANGGFRGRFIGNTQTNFGYEKHYDERRVLNSKKVFSLNYNWGLSIYGRRNRIDGGVFPMTKWGTIGSGGKAVPGIVCIRASQFWTSQNENCNPFTPYGSTNTNFQLSENIYSNAINFYLGDFIDNKLLSDDGTKGAFLSYNKFRIKSFTVHFKLVSIPQNVSATTNHVLHNGRNNNGWEPQLNTNDKYEFQKVRLTDSTDLFTKGYFVYRDIYNSYANNQNLIPIIPPSAYAAATGDDAYKREQFVIKNLDSNLTYVKEGEEFSFTREINAQGSYYLDKAGILAHLKTSIGTIVASLEGQVQDSTNIVKKLPEGFNFLFVPGESDLEIYGEIGLGGPSGVPNVGNGYLCLVNLYSIMHVKTTAVWECFDFNYASTGPPTLFSDPLEKALIEFNMSRTIETGQLNRPIGSKKL